MCQITLDLEQKLVVKEYFISETKHIYPLPWTNYAISAMTIIRTQWCRCLWTIHVQLNKRIVKMSVNIAILDLGLRDSL